MLSSVGGTADIVLALGSNINPLVVRFALTSRRLWLNGLVAESEEAGLDGDLAPSDVSRSLKIECAGVALLGVAVGRLGVCEGASGMPAMRIS